MKVEYLFFNNIFLGFDSMNFGGRTEAAGTCRQPLVVRDLFEEPMSAEENNGMKNKEMNPRLGNKCHCWHRRRCGNKRFHGVSGRLL